MKIVNVKDYDELCRQMANEIIEQVRQSQQPFHLGLATGSTPEGVYKQLIHDHQTNGTSYQHVHTYNLDEYIGIPIDHPNSYHYYMRQRFFDHIDIPIEQTHLPNGLAPNIDLECRRYEALIDRINGVDLQILGIGNNGHIGFNEPGTLFGSHTQKVALTQSTREANKRFFASIEQVPTSAITMGIATILKAKQIFLLASGEHKAEIVKQLLKGEITQSLPASALKLHRHVTIVADTAALSLVDEEEVFCFVTQRK